MISKEVNKLFSDLVRAGLFLPNADGTKAFAHLLGQITMKGQPKLYGHKIMLKKRKKDNRPFLHYWDIEKQGYRYATNWEIL